MIRRPPRSTPLYSSAASDVYKRQPLKVPNVFFVYQQFIWYVKMSRSGNRAAAERDREMEVLAADRARLAARVEYLSAEVDRLNSELERTKTAAAVPLQGGWSRHSSSPFSRSSPPAPRHSCSPVHATVITELKQLLENNQVSAYLLTCIHYGAVLSRRRPHHVSILSVCPSVPCLLLFTYRFRYVSLNSYGKRNSHSKDTAKTAP